MSMRYHAAFLILPGQPNGGTGSRGRGATKAKALEAARADFRVRFGRAPHVAACTPLVARSSKRLASLIETELERRLELPSVSEE